MRDIDSYTHEYLADYGFEREMVHYRKRFVLERILALQPKSVVEIGCGDELLLEAYSELGGKCRSWTFVEPSHRFANNARKQCLVGLTVIEGFFEDVHFDIPNKQPDMVICSGLLHEVPSVERLITSIVNIMGPETVLHANVPSALSMHRRLAQTMGLIDELASPSDRNMELDQRRVFNIDVLRKVLEEGSLNVEECGGYFVKPFTHRQMETAAPILTRAVLDGLFELGRINPSWASEIYAEAKLS